MTESDLFWTGTSSLLPSLQSFSFFFQCLKIHQSNYLFPLKSLIRRTFKFFKKEKKRGEIQGWWLEVWARKSKIGKRNLYIIGSYSFDQLYDVFKKACKGCSVMESPFIRAPGIPLSQNKKGKRRWKSLAEWGKTSEMLGLKKVQVLQNPSQI